MRGMILAAGRGQRMGDLTLNQPKPLLKMNGKYLIEYAIEALLAANIRDIIINISYHAELIRNALGTGDFYGARFFYSYEEHALETGGGIIKALPLLGAEPFIVVSSDIISNYPLTNLILTPNKLAHLVLVPNPSYHPQGDFGLKEKTVLITAEETFTYANIGLYHPDLFADTTPTYCKLGGLLKKAIHDKNITGEIFTGRWYNVGTPQDILTVSSSFL